MGKTLTKLRKNTYKIKEKHLHYYFFLVPQTPINREYQKVIHTYLIKVFNNKGLL